MGVLAGWSRELPAVGDLHAGLFHTGPSHRQPPCGAGGPGQAKLKRVKAQGRSRGLSTSRLQCDPRDPKEAPRQLSQVHRRQEARRPRQAPSAAGRLTFPSWCREPGEAGGTWRLGHGPTRLAEVGPAPPTPRGREAPSPRVARASAMCQMAAEAPQLVDSPQHMPARSSASPAGWCMSSGSRWLPSAAGPAAAGRASPYHSGRGSDVTEGGEERLPHRHFPASQLSLPAHQPQGRGAGPDRRSLLRSGFTGTIGSHPLAGPRKSQEN